MVPGQLDNCCRLINLFQGQADVQGFSEQPLKDVLSDLGVQVLEFDDGLLESHHL